MTETQPDRGEWTAGEGYEPYIGRWSRLVASEFLAWLAVPHRRAWLDVGCGTGALTQAVVSRQDPVAVAGIDRSEGFVQYARNHTADARANFEVGDAQRLAFASGCVEAAVSGLVLNFVPEPLEMILEMKRATREDGTVAVYIWDYPGKMQLLRHFWNAAAALDPAARDLDEGVRFPLCNPDALRHLFEAAHLGDVQSRSIDIDMHFKDFDDFWLPFLGGQGPAPAYAMSLAADAHARLRERIRDSLPTAVDGSIQLVARAWAVKGIK